MVIWETIKLIGFIFLWCISNFLIVELSAISAKMKQTSGLEKSNKKQVLISEVSDLEVNSYHNIMITAGIS